MVVVVAAADSLKVVDRCAYSFEVGSDAFASYSVGDVALCLVAFDDSCYHSFSAVEVVEAAEEALYYQLEIYCSTSVDDLLLLLQDHSDQSHYYSALCL
jgi:hypothetical protein